MKSIYILLVILISIVNISCQTDPNEAVDEGKVTGYTYTSDDIGWSIQIPEGWEVTGKDAQQARVERGQEAFEDATNLEIDVSNLRHLIGFQKDQFNIFQSTSERFELEYEGEWESNFKDVTELICVMYEDNGIAYDTLSGTEIIDGLEFKKFNVTIYSPKGDIILYQEVYGRHINGFDFSVNINYNNENDKIELVSALKNSKFNIRNN